MWIIGLIETNSQKYVRQFVFLLVVDDDDDLRGVEDEIAQLSSSADEAEQQLMSLGADVERYNAELTEQDEENRALDAVARAAADKLIRIKTDLSTRLSSIEQLHDRIARGENGYSDSGMYRNIDVV